MSQVAECDAAELHADVRFPGRFQGLADVYAVGRPVYPARLARRVATLLGLDGQHDVLDLGTGPGFLALDFRPFARRVVGVDPEPQMLRVAAAAARAAGVAIELVQGSSSSLGPELGRFRAVTIGRAFHWMDRPRTLATLDTLIEPGGAVVLFADSYPDVPANAWHARFLSVIDRYAGNDPARDVLATAKNHEAVLSVSPFGHLERVAVLEPRTTPIERFVDRALSYGRAWDGRPGPHSEGLARDIRAALQPFAMDGLINEVLEGTALIARRPHEVD